MSCLAEPLGYFCIMLIPVSGLLTVARIPPGPVLMQYRTTVLGVPLPPTPPHPSANQPFLPSLAKPGYVHPVPGAEMAPEMTQSAWCWRCPAAACCHKVVLQAQLSVPGEGDCHTELGSGCIRMTQGRHECQKP